jgi:SNF2 family DNA or RNA helicase
MDGSYASVKRQELVDAFNAYPGPGVMVMTIKACAVGINLTSATRAIIVDSQWNPIYPAQAAARCHRIGQVRTLDALALRLDLEIHLQ